MAGADRSLTQSLASALHLNFASRERARRRIAEVRVLGERSLLATWRPRRAREGGRILCYHSVGQPELGVNDIAPSRFVLHLETAMSMGYRFVAAEKIAEGKSGPRDLAVTFDDAWASVFHTARPILQRMNVPWTVFVVTDWSETGALGDIPVMGWRELERLRSDGVTIGSHSRSHPDFGRLDDASMQAELSQSRAIIAARLGAAPDTLAIPFGLARNWPARARALAGQAGYRFVFAQAEDRRPEGTIGRSFVSRFDSRRLFGALLDGAFDNWEEWVWPD